MEAISTQPKLTFIQSSFLSLFKSYGAAMLPTNAAIRLILPSGAEALIGNQAALPEDKATVSVCDGSLFSTVVMRSEIGLGEAYMDGTFITDDIYHLIEVVSRTSCDASARQATFSSLGFVGSILYRISESSRWRHTVRIPTQRRRHATSHTTMMLVTTFTSSS